MICDDAAVGRAAASGQLVSVVVPTYCEAANLRLLIPRIHDSLAAASLSYEIIVVDDDSPDNTTQVCDELGRDFPVRLIVRTAVRGLATAVITGMESARGELIVCMDADLSHPPESIPHLIDALAVPTVDLVIGSRYVAGGETDEHWGIFRWLNSRIATWMARPLTSAKDPMAGFFALRREMFRRAHSRLDPVGYKIGLELMVKANCRSVVEVPITFHDRAHGESKLSWREQLNYLRHLGRLYAFRFEAGTCFVKFGLVGSSGVAVDLTAYWLLLSRLPVVWASALAIWLAMTWNFFLNRQVTFPKARRRRFYRQYLLYCLSCLAGAVVNLIVRVALSSTHQFFADHLLFGAIAGIGCGFVLNYLICRNVVFSPTHGTGL